jgi:hypothetical protein
MDNFEVPRFLDSQRGQPLLVEGWKLYAVSKKKRLADGVTDRCYWKCCDSSCCGSGQTDFVGNIHGIFTVSEAHLVTCEHTQQTVVISYYRQRLLQDLKDHPTLDFSVMYTAATDHLELNFPQFSVFFPPQYSFSSTVSRFRNALLPVQPTLANLATLVVPLNYSTCLGNGLRFLQYQSTHNEPTGTSHMMVFGSDESFRLLCLAEEAYMDGTFFVAPHPYYQLFIIHFLRGHRMIPTLFCFLSRKTKETYQHLFTWIATEALVRNHPVAWKFVR